MPKVSIVMPTRERPHLLRFALASALDQTFEDVEIVVSDNYSGFQTREVVDSFQTTKIRYVRTDRPLSMPDSWEFALHNASGDFITFLTDDSYLLPDAIYSAVAKSEDSGKKMVAWGLCTYFAWDWLEPERRNCLYISNSSYESYLVRSSDSLRTLFDLGPANRIPRMLNCMIHRVLVEKATQVQGRFFLPPAPDYAGAIGLLQQTEDYVFMDWPLYINGVFPQSIGASQRFSGGKASQDFIAEFRERSDVTGVIGLDIHVPAVIIAQTLETMRGFYPTLLFSVNQRNLICDIVNDLVVHESNGADVSQDWRTLEVYLSGQPSWLQDVAQRQKIRSKLMLVLKRVRRVPFWEYLERLRGIHVFSGDQWGFSNIGECGKFAAETIEKMAQAHPS